MVATLDDILKVRLGTAGISSESIAFLQEKGLGEDSLKKDFSRLIEILGLPDQTFSQRRAVRSWLDVTLDRGDAGEITTGRYERGLSAFRDISSEQALVQGRMEFAVEYIIRLSDFITKSGMKTELVPRAFDDGEKAKLRSIYQEFRTKDYAA